MKLHTNGAVNATTVINTTPSRSSHNRVLLIQSQACNDETCQVFPIFQLT